ncbi:hypothetical protein BGZ47_000767 [Haplosporangium gracile]|nr:hypothetical protein BGZ47_000767 [Haplosporangium gracile]
MKTFRLVDGETISNSFLANMASDDTAADVKKFIKSENVIATHSSAVAFIVSVKVNPLATFKWETVPSQASLKDLHDWIRVKCGKAVNERRLIYDFVQGILL